MTSITSDAINTTSIQQARSRTSKFIPSALCVRITSVILITLAILATVGSCAALIITLNLWFLLLSTVAGVCLSLGIIINFMLPVKKENGHIS
ncbi:hypothetical protein SBV42_04270 [Chlamydia crocodili]|uniref:Inclusion membrane protein n=1 Tax=Chlamydia crocodili TaxID=2766982 RepID=A0ABX8CIG8_9CHLA|nr:hypothetical protein [Chlamydia crocodili]QVE48972.1 hypothetical protein H9Q19_04640 [Chlamydia crocodili]